MKIIKQLLLLGLAVVITGCGSNTATKQTITVYKSYTCSCCAGWVDHMKDNGYKVDVVNMEDNAMTKIKRKYNIPRSMRSCHTTVAGGYIVEGHVPARVVDELLSERPAIDGIALPGMPAGSPGMPGWKKETWKIYALKDRRTSLYKEM